MVACGPSAEWVPEESGKDRRGIASYCLAREGQRVGDGECWTLADQAFRAAGFARPGKDLRVWGRKIDYRATMLEPGDIIEFRSAAFADGTVTGREHTAIVVMRGNARQVRIAEQNWGMRNVRIRDLDLLGLRTGGLTVYRPILR